jgi:hypothetical protein
VWYCCGALARLMDLMGSLGSPSGVSQGRHSFCKAGRPWDTSGVVGSRHKADERQVAVCPSRKWSVYRSSRG